MFIFFVNNLSSEHWTQSQEDTTKRPSLDTLMSSDGPHGPDPAVTGKKKHSTF